MACDHGPESGDVWAQSNGCSGFTLPVLMKMPQTTRLLFGDSGLEFESGPLEVEGGGRRGKGLFQRDKTQSERSFCSKRQADPAQKLSSQPFRTVGGIQPTQTRHPAEVVRV